MDKLPEANDDRIPTYEESVRSSAIKSGSTSKEGQQESLSLPQQLANVRTVRIHSIVSAYINPLLQAQAFAGLFKTTIVLVPSNTDSLQSSSASGNDVIEGSGDAISHNATEAVIGFPDDEYVKLVRLRGEEYANEFWRQPAVIRELESTLKSSLVGSGHKIHEQSAQQSKPVPVVIPAASELPKSKRGFFSRRSQSEASPASAPLQQQDAASAATYSDTLNPGHVRVSVGLDEVVLRVVTDMGLYDTRTGSAVVVKMEIGS